MTDVFEHTPQVWKAAPLRDALSDLPNDAPIRIGVAGDPGDFDGYRDFVAASEKAYEDSSASAMGTPTLELSGVELPEFERGYLAHYTGYPAWTRKALIPPGLLPSTWQQT
ncbi:DUF6225 family protein [Streptomyces sp. NPDC057963]|uniref:DUF6225 family protein n=1 Tax=Streptomyces sp. NPDC057963 TaxID=3346290 RepID=UPI0036E8CBBB